MQIINDALNVILVVDGPYVHYSSRTKWVFVMLLSALAGIPCYYIF